MNGSDLTASGIISFTQRLEDRLTEFYEGLAERFPEQGKAFHTFAKESRKNKKLVVRTYRETITDAFEACFSFAGFDVQAYEVDTTLAPDTGYVQALEKAIELEDLAREFHLEVAERSQSLLATIAMAFERVAKRRSKQRAKLQSLLDEARDTA
jgi:hypothetical protein